MVRLLQGKLASVEDMNALVPLTKNNFTDTNYERAVTEPVLQTVISASVTDNSTSFEDEHADMDAEMASIDTSNMNALSFRRLVVNTSVTTNSNHQQQQPITPTPTNQQHRAANLDIQLQQLHQHAARSDHVTPRPTDEPLPILTHRPRANK